MKKFLSIFICLSMLCGLFCFSVGAVSITASREELNAQLLDGTVNGTDYAYYSPVKENDTTKYPLMIWLHGNSSGDYPRHQLLWYGFSNWASDEYQARFKNAGGCFLFVPRACSLGNSWDTVASSDLKGRIEEFISLHKENIDTSRIYISGYSAGADMTWNMLITYPAFFAAGVPCAAITPPTPIEASVLTDTSVWMFNSDIDYYLSARTEAIRPVFNQLKQISNRKSGIRLTSFSEVVLSYGEKHEDIRREHISWEAITFDMHMSDRVTPYKFTTTTDANGDIFTFENPDEGVISWLSQQTNETTADRVSVIERFFKSILEFFKKLFDMIFGEAQ